MKPLKQTSLKQWETLVKERGLATDRRTGTHWRVTAHDTRFDVWPTSGKWREEGHGIKRGTNWFAERVDEIGDGIWE